MARKIIRIHFAIWLGQPCGDGGICKELRVVSQGTQATRQGAGVMACALGIENSSEPDNQIGAHGRKECAKKCGRLDAELWILLQQLNDATENLVVELQVVNVITHRLEKPLKFCFR